MSQEHPAFGSPEDEARLSSEFHELLERSEADPEAQYIYRDTLQRAAFFAAGPKVRKSLGLTQKDVAAMMGTTQSAVSDLEAGRVEPTLRTLQRYARALGTRLDFALVDKELPAFSDGTANALFDQVRLTALSPLLAKLLRPSEEEERTLHALADTVLIPEPLLRPILSSLQDEGWATSRGDGADRVYSLVDEAAQLVGVSLHRDRVAGVLVDMDGTVLQDSSVSLTDSGRHTVIDTTTDVIANLLNRSDKPVLGIGVSLAGVVNVAEGRVLFAPDLQSDDDPWDGVDLRDQLRAGILARLGREYPLVVENDANALAAFEYLRRKDDSVAVVLLSGGGIGAGIAIEGKIIHGSHSLAGEGGHVVIDPDGPPCRAGLEHRGCLETVATAKGILTNLNLLPVDTFQQYTAGLAVANDRIRSDDVSVASAFRDAGHALGHFLASIVRLIDPARAVFYAHPYLASKEYDCGRQFQEGVQAALDETDTSRLDVVPPPRLEWHVRDANTSAIAAGAVALWEFVKYPAGAVPPLRPRAKGLQPQWV